MKKEYDTSVKEAIERVMSVFSEYIKTTPYFDIVWSGTQSMPVEKLIAQVEALPFSDDAKEHILYNNAKTFYEQL